ncbi:MAG: ABC-type transporter, integral rane subunit, partial [Frankiales bacterium]|nr:ABC-type transporter, integral rane subunit [Frankiales bacterium]
SGLRLVALLDDGIAVRALVAAVLVGVVAGAVGVQVVLRKLSFFTMAMTHATFPGVVLAQILGWDLLLGSAGFGLLVVLAFAFLTQRDNLDDTSATGVVLSGGLAVGTLLLSTQSGFTKDLTAFLVGDPLSVTTGQLVTMAVIGVLVLTVLAALGKVLTLAAFDRGALVAQGFNVRVLDVVLLVCIEVTVIACVRTVGTILAVALIVAPAAAARLWTNRILAMTVLSCAFAVLSGVVGVVVTENADVAGGAITVLVATGLFVLSLTFAPARAALARRAGAGTPVPAA